MPDKLTEKSHLDIFLKLLEKANGMKLRVLEEFERDTDESPDFVAELNGQFIGIEHTQSIYGEQARGFKLRHQLSGGANITHLKDREGEHRSDEELIQEMGNMRSPWAESAVFTGEWKKKASAGIEKKRKVLNGTHYQHHDQNWLLIFDDVGFIDNQITYREACKQLKEIASVASSHERDFDRIFIVSGECLFGIMGGEVVIVYPPI